MRKNHKISICILCFLVLLQCVVGCQEKKRTPQEMSDDELRIAVLSEMNLSEMWYYSNEDYTLNIPIGISLMVEKYPVFREAVEREVFDGADAIAMKELLENRECVATEEERETFLMEYQGWKESFGGKLVDSEILEPYRTLLEVKWERDAGTGQYEYPINAKSEEWTLLTESGKRAVCKIPQAVLDDITDDELVDLVLKYPLLVETVTEDEFFRGFEKVSAYFEPLKIMHEKGLLQKYTEEELEDKLEQSPEIAITFVENYFKTYGD